MANPPVNLVKVLRPKATPVEAYVMRVTAPSAMSKTERAYSQWLQLRVEKREIVGFRFEALRLELAPRTTYTPDFMVTVTLDPLWIELHEVKGSWKAPHQEDARVKLKVAATMFPEFKFMAAVSIPQKKGGGWEFERFDRRLP